MSTFALRPATAADLPAMAEIYVDAVDTLGPRAYTAEQIAAWRRWPEDEPAEFARRLMAGHAWVAEADGHPVAFAEFTPPDHLDFLYTKGEVSGRGLATRLHEHLEQVAREGKATQLRTEASLLSRPVFARLGYEVTALEDVERFGASFRRFKMRKILRPGAPATGSAVTCIRRHEPSFEHAPRMEAEETATLTQHDAGNPGWFKGIDPRGVVGYFPTDWFLIETNGPQAVAQRDYHANELPVAVGDSVHVIDTVGPWARVMNAQAKCGWIPLTSLRDETAS